MRITRRSGGTFDFIDSDIQRELSDEEKKIIIRGYEEAGKGKKLIKCATELCTGIFTKKCDWCSNYYCSKHFENHICAEKTKHQENGQYFPNESTMQRLSADEKLAIRKAYGNLRAKKELKN